MPSERSPRVTFGSAARETLAQFWGGSGTTQCAALAFYTLFSLAPVLLVAIAIAGAVFGESAARAEIERQFSGLMGSKGAEFVRVLLEQAAAPESRTRANWTGGVIFFFGAATVFNQLQEALNAIWGVEPRRRHWIANFLSKRLLSFGLVIAGGFLLIVSLLLSAILAAFGEYLQRRFAVPAPLIEGVHAILFLMILTAFLMALYRWLPDARIAWRDVAVGAVVTAGAFALGKWAIGRYLGSGGVGSIYGVAGSLVVVLLWVYYSSMIVLAGASFTRAYSRRFQPVVVPEPGAKRIPAEEAV